MADFNFDVEAEVDDWISEGENFSGTKRGWTTETVGVSKDSENYDYVVEYRFWEGNDINHKEKAFLIGITPEGDIHRWEKEETGPDYGRKVQSDNREGASEKGDYEWKDTADRPNLKDTGENSPREVAKGYLEERVHYVEIEDIDEMLR